MDVNTIRRLFKKHLRVPEGGLLATYPGTVTFEPDLTPEQVKTFDEIIARFNEAESDHDQYESVHRGQLRAYLDSKSPTQAQTANALKLVIRVVLLMMDGLHRVE
jgi:hypothetical protein